MNNKEKRERAKRIAHLRRVGRVLAAAGTIVVRGVKPDLQHDDEDDDGPEEASYSAAVRVEGE